MDKSFAIGGHGGFTFNRKRDEVKINGYKPFKANHYTPLIEQQKEYNNHFSQMRVIVVEKTISRVKQWKISKLLFRYFKGNHHQLDFNDI